MREHDVVLYGNDAAALARWVTPFIGSALQDGGAAVIIACSEHERGFRSALAALAIDPTSSAVSERLFFLDASDLAKSLLSGGKVVPGRFERLIGHKIRTLCERYSVHAYGEIVGIYRALGKPDAARDLEQLWNELLEETPFRLLCGYPVDVLGSPDPAKEMDPIFTSHTALVSALPGFQSALEASIESALGAQRAAAIRGMIESSSRPGWPAMSSPESTLLWLRENYAQRADAIIEDARDR